MVMNVFVQAALTLNIYANPIAFKYFEGHACRLYLIYTVWTGYCYNYFVLIFLLLRST